MQKKGERNKTILMCSVLQQGHAAQDANAFRLALFTFHLKSPVSPWPYLCC